MKKLFALLMLSTLSISIFAQAGTIDSLFGTDGHIVVPNMSYAIDLLELNDGQVLVSGLKYKDNSSKMAISKYSIDGTISSDFGDNGTLVVPLTWNASGFNIEEYDEDRFMVMGHGNNATNDITVTIGRFYNNGQVDSTFGESGFISFASKLAGMGLQVLEDKSMILTYGILYENAKQKISKLLSNGSFDANFGVDGTINLPFSSDVEYFLSPMVKLHGDKLLLVGNIEFATLDGGFGALQLNIDGTLDTSFGEGGLVVIGNENVDFDESLDYFQIRKDGRIHLSGYLSGGFTADSLFTFQFMPNGAIDTSYGENGSSVIPVPGTGYIEQIFSSTIQADGKIVIVGDGYNEQFIARLNADGTLDTDFGNSGLIPTEGFNFLTTSQFTKTVGINVKFMKDNSLWCLGGYNDGALGSITKYKAGTILGIPKVNLDHIPMVVYPNPVEDILSVQYEIKSTESVHFLLWNLSGKLIQDFGQVQGGKGYNEQSLVLPKNISSGNYLLTLDASNAESTLLITVK